MDLGALSNQLNALLSLGINQQELIIKNLIALWPVAELGMIWIHLRS